MNSSAVQRAAGHAAAGMSSLFLRRTRYRYAIEQELVALASLVLAVTDSTKCILARVPEGAERQQLLLACEQLAQAAGGVVDPRSRIQHLSESGVEDALHAFVAHQERSACVRSAALAAAVKREPSSRSMRKSSRSPAAAAVRSFPMPSRESASTWMLTMPARARWRSALRFGCSPVSLWRSIGRALEGRLRAGGSGA
ncbi:hypothetical protein JJB11_03645 [Ramlibacter ginsenosidimutans]|uniref:Uncharacterized protein n=1 Tax=Ramlibacter ginsenosidimutans TaxID=502333 RepID=A0A934TQ14_9BURK|nr:hypothetical protein [Ramlibacter ginsenosidimutans]MBK6005175.1 hypothetical protein [Ramlibacter ginsenosidimutans]